MNPTSTSRGVAEHRQARRGHWLVLALITAAWAPQALAAVTAPVAGEIQNITIINPLDHWSGGTISVGGTLVTIPRNLLIDLPANRLTLQQLYELAPPTCRAVGQSGLAKGDSCNTSGMGAIATISANYTLAGNVIAGDVLIEKGIESIIGTISYIDYNDGYFRLNGVPNDLNTGVMVRLNDPGSRHTVQQGKGCAAGSENCSADPRFTLDQDNYTNTFSSGYPWCIPSTVQRGPFVDLIGLGVTVAQAAADGTGDVLCPQTNRPATGIQAADSRRFAPIKLGDSINAEGNFETVNGVRFLSAHSTMVQAALTTSPAANQPDYIFIEEAFIDGPGFQNERARSLFIGFATLAPADVLLWSIHYDPTTNSKQLLPLGTTRGCDLADGTVPGLAATCSGQGLVANGADIFRIRHDVDFTAGAKPRLNPCAHLVADPRMGAGICPNGGAGADTLPMTIAEQFAILSPIPHEIQFQTGKKWASEHGGTPLISLDIEGRSTPNGQYLFPFGMNLGGIDIPNAFEFNLSAVNTPFSFSGIPWNLDRRLSPGGCIDTDGNGTVDCEATPQPLDPFPFEGTDPRLLAAIPVNPTAYNDPNFTAAPLTQVRDRILSFVDAQGRFQGNNSILAWPPGEPAFQSIVPTPDVGLVCSAGAVVTPPTAGVPDAINLAQFRTLGPNEWLVTGTSSVPSAIITIHTGPDLTGPLLATVAADANGSWSFLETNSLTASTTSVSVQSSGGAVILNFPVIVR
jgi:hypothetical protein